tara:strand:- start:914 stop:1102 length:189 start_codon:yes stop_codon:yes gene_type:complete
MWTLVFIYFYEVTPYVELVSTHTNMVECFQAREELSEFHGMGGGYFKPEQQAICINMNRSDI